MYVYAHHREGVRSHVAETVTVHILRTVIGSHFLAIGPLLDVNLGDDADTISAVYGQLAGAFYGIPEEWRLMGADRDLIENFAKDVYSLSLGVLAHSSKLRDLDQTGLHRWSSEIISRIERGSGTIMECDHQQP